MKSGQIRHELLRKGAAALESQLEDAVSYAMQLQGNRSLRNVEVLGTALTRNRSLPAQIKKQVQTYRENLHKILLGIASYMEDDKFSAVDEAVGSLELSQYDQSRLLKLFKAQKDISFSYQTLSVAIEVFTSVNESLLNKISQSKPGTDQVGHTRLLLQNAILVYELTDFVSQFIEEFGLAGVDEVRSIQKDVFDDIERNRSDDERLMNKLEAASQDETRRMVLRDIQNREEVRDVVKAKWNEFNEKIESMDEGVHSAKRIATDLEIIRDNARNQIETLQLIATTQIMESNLEIVKNLSHIKNFALAPLTPEDAFSLLGITPPGGLLEPPQKPRRRRRKSKPEPTIEDA